MYLPSVLTCWSNTIRLITLGFIRGCRIKGLGQYNTLFLSIPTSTSIQKISRLEFYPSTGFNGLTLFMLGFPRIFNFSLRLLSGLFCTPVFVPVSLHCPLELLEGNDLDFYLLTGYSVPYTPVGSLQLFVSFP